MADWQRICSGSVLPQCHNGQDERDAEEYGAGFQNAGDDKTQREPFVVPFEQREQHNCGANASECHDELEETAEGGCCVGAGAEDVVRPLHRAIESEGRDRNKRQQVEGAGDQRSASLWRPSSDCSGVHRLVALCRLSSSEVSARRSDQRAYPSQARANPTGTAIFGWDALGSRPATGANTVPAASSAPAQRGRMRARNVATPKSRPPTI